MADPTGSANGGIVPSDKIQQRHRSTHGAVALREKATVGPALREGGTRTCCGGLALRNGPFDAWVAIGLPVVRDVAPTTLVVVKRVQPAFCAAGRAQPVIAFAAGGGRE